LTKLGKNRPTYPDIYMIFRSVFAKYLSELKVFRSHVGRKIIKVFMPKCTFFNSYISMKLRKSDRRCPKCYKPIYFLSLFTSMSHLLC